MVFRNIDHSVLALIKGSQSGLLPNAGIWQSFDAGAHWTHIFPPPADIQNFDSLFPNHKLPLDYYGVDVDSHGAVIVCSDSGVFMSSALISTWEKISTGLNWGDWDSSRYINCTQVVENPVTHKYYASSRAQSCTKASRS